MTENKTKNITFSLFIDVVCYMHLANSVGYSRTAFLDLIVVSCFVTVRSDNGYFSGGDDMILSVQFKLKDCTVWKTVCETNIKGGAEGGGNLTFIF